MIDLTARRNVGASRALKIIGVGGAGANALDRMVLDGVNTSHLICLNTDAQALHASVAGEKIQLGIEATRGLGSGGDPELGAEAAQEAVRAISDAVEGLDAIFLLGGLGGGTGSGALPAVAELAKEAGALVIAVVTLPFSFEGKRRKGQALEALAALERHADAVVCFENDRMADGVSPHAGVQQAFIAADQTMSQSVQAMVRLLASKGLIHLGFDDIKAALRTIHGGAHARSIFAYGEAAGGNRPFDALAFALRNPLIDKGRLLRETSTLLVQVSGGPEMTLNEVELLMEELHRHVDDRTAILFGTAVDPVLEGRMSVTLLGSLAPEGIVAPAVRFASEAASFVEETPARHEEVVEPASNVLSFPSEDEVERSNDSFFAGVPEEELIARDEEDVITDGAVEEEVVFEEPAIEEEPLEPQVQPKMQGSLFHDETPEEEPSAPAEAAPAPPSPWPFSDAGKVSRPVPGRSFHRTPAPSPAPITPITPSSPITPEVTESYEEVEEVVEGPAPVQNVRRTAPETAALQRMAVSIEPAHTPPASAASEGIPSKVATQETLKFEPVVRGRFEKSEPTIVNGQDLDVPTFLRQNLRIRQHD